MRIYCFGINLIFTSVIIFARIVIPHVLTLWPSQVVSMSVYLTFQKRFGHSLAVPRVLQLVRFSRSHPSVGTLAVGRSFSPHHPQLTQFYDGLGGEGRPLDSVRGLQLNGLRAGTARRQKHACGHRQWAVAHRLSLAFFVLFSLRA